MKLLLSAVLGLLSLGSLSDIAPAQSVLATVPVGNSPVWLAVNNRTNMVYVANEFDNTVSVIDGATNQVVATIPVGSVPRFVAVNVNTNRIYVSNNNGNQVSVIDGNRNVALPSIQLTQTGNIDLQQVAVNSKTNRIYVASANQNLAANFFVIDGKSSKVIAKLSIRNSEVVGVDTTRNLIYVATSGFADNVVVVDGATNSIVNKFSIPNSGSGFQSIAVDETNNRLYLVDDVYELLRVVDAPTGATLGTVGGFNFLLDVDGFRNQEMAVVTSAHDNKISYIDTSSFQVVKDVTVGNYAWGVAINQTTKRVYVSNQGDNTVSVVSALR